MYLDKQKKLQTDDYYYYLWACYSFVKISIVTWFSVIKKSLWDLFFMYALI